MVVVAVGWYGNYLYKQDDLTFVQLSSSTDLVKCITNDGSVIYGKVPHGTICEKTEIVEGLLTVVPSEAPNKTTDEVETFKFSSNKEITSTSRFRCDGRTFCSQMASCDEARFFLNNCPNTKMDGNKDGVPCQEQWCR